MRTGSFFDSRNGGGWRTLLIEETCIYYSVRWAQNTTDQAMHFPLHHRGLVWSNHPELIRNCPVGLLPKVAHTKATVSLNSFCPIAKGSQVLRYVAPVYSAYPGICSTTQRAPSSMDRLMWTLFRSSTMYWLLYVPEYVRDKYCVYVLRIYVCVCNG